MAHNSQQLPCDGEGICMRCKEKPSVEESLTCNTCVTPWHVNCLSSPPETLTSTLQWECPDCSPVTVDPTFVPMASITTGDAAASDTTGNLTAAILAIEADESLTREEKAKKRQNLMTGTPDLNESKSNIDGENEGGGNEILNLLDKSLKCMVCMQLPERPVTTPCGHNFCLKCFQKWLALGKTTCINCRIIIPPKMASQPRINAALVEAIRMARASNSTSAVGPMKIYHFVQNQNKPDKAYTTERAKKSGKANACSGKIFVTVAPDHFGPILAENDPERKQGVLVGECWEDRMECRQWGAHFPHVAGIAGQSDHGAQSVALSGGYLDDEDHGEWFLYTGSGGRDLSGNKRTNKDQSFDQKFEKSNEALRVSCKKGYPVRVVRSHKEKRSAYAPETGVRYDGVYRIEKCWRKPGIQGYKVCRYLFVRCDNAPAPWTSDEHGDRPRPLPIIEELKKATDITERKESPAWDYHETEGCWKWKKAPPMSRKPSNNEDPEDRKRARRALKQAQDLTLTEKLLKGFGCLMCRQVMTHPVTTPCAHNFCKPCLEGAFSGQAFIKERTCQGRRTLRAQKNVMKCPSCPADISDFLRNPQVNRELMALIEKLQRKTDEIVEDSSADVEDSSTDNNGIEENAGTMMEDTKTSTQNSEILEGRNKDIAVIFQGKTDENVEESEEIVENLNDEENVENLNDEENDIVEKSGAMSEDTIGSTQISEDTIGSTQISELAEAGDGDTGVAESLQCKINGNIEKINGSIEKAGQDSSKEDNDESEAAMEDNKATPKVSKIPEEGYREMQNDSTPTRTRYRRACKRESPDGGKDSLSPNGVKKIKLSGKESDVVIEITQNGTVKPEIPENDKEDMKSPMAEMTPERSPKRKKANICDRVSSPGSGVRTRSMKF